MATTMNENDIDPDLWAMRWMSDDELNRFTSALEVIEQENKWMEELKKTAKLRPLDRLTEQEKQEYFVHTGRFNRAHEQRLDLLHKYTNQGMACVQLIDYTLAAIESLFEEGQFDQVAGLPDFWRLVYHRILRDQGSTIRADARFRGVKILDTLRDHLTELLPGFADLHFRRKCDNPILAQFLEKLAGR